jgi:hypothetical protein
MPHSNIAMSFKHLYLYVDRCGSKNGQQNDTCSKRLDYVLKIW